MGELSGKCHCGNNSFTVSSEPEFQFICYCSGCKVINGGGHLCGILLSREGLSEARNTKLYSYPGGSGSAIEMHFCPNCSTQLYAFPTEYKGKVVVRANVLDGFDFEPQKALFPELAFSWDTPDQSL